MDLLNGKIKPLYFKYLSAAFGSALISSIYGMVDMAIRIHFVKPPSLRFISSKIIVGVAKWTNTVNGQDERLRRH